MWGRLNVGLALCVCGCRAGRVAGHACCRAGHSLTISRAGHSLLLQFNSETILRGSSTI